MKNSLILTLVLAVISFTACGNKSGASSETADSSNVDSVKVDSVEKTTFFVDDDKAFVENFYTNVVLSWGEPGVDEKALEEALLKAITPEIAKKIKSQYGYYKVHLLRSGAEDGPEDESTVLSVESEGDRWYAVKYSDMGLICTTRVHLTGDINDMRIDDYKPTDLH